MNSLNKEDIIATFASFKALSQKANEIMKILILTKVADSNQTKIEDIEDLYFRVNSAVEEGVEVWWEEDEGDWNSGWNFIIPWKYFEKDTGIEDWNVVMQRKQEALLKKQEEERTAAALAKKNIEQIRKSPDFKQYLEMKKKFKPYMESFEDSFI